MHLTRYTDFTLRVLMYLGTRDGLTTIGEIAERFAISRNHLTKIVHQLARQGLVATTRGTGGGVRLGRAPGEIGVGAVVRASELTLEMVDCDSPPCPIGGGCRLQGVLREARDAFLAVLDRYTLEDLLANRQQIAGLLGLERREVAAGAV